MARITGDPEPFRNLEGYTVYQRDGQWFLREKPDKAPKRPESAILRSINNRTKIIAEIAIEWDDVIRTGMESALLGLDTNHLMNNLRTSLRHAIPHNRDLGKPIPLNELTPELFRFNTFLNRPLGKFFPGKIQLSPSENNNFWKISFEAPSGHNLVKASNGRKWYSLSVIIIPVPLFEGVFMSNDNRREFAPINWNSGIQSVLQPFSMPEQAVELNFNNRDFQKYPGSSFLAMGVLRYFTKKGQHFFAGKDADCFEILGLW